MTPTQFELLVNSLLNAYGYNSINPKKKIAGRGTIHQIDALGVNKLTPTFSYPITLLAEAKYYRPDRTVGIGILRNFYGVISDVRQAIPSNFVKPELNGNVYINGTTNIIGLLISTSGFSSFAKSFAYSHGIFLVTVNFVKKNHSPLFANLGGQPVILQIPDKLKLDLGLQKIREIKFEKVSGKEVLTYLGKDPIKGEMKLVKTVTYTNKKSKSELDNDNEELINCFMYDIKVKYLNSTFRTISQYEILDDTLLTRYSGLSEHPISD